MTLLAAQLPANQVLALRVALGAIVPPGLLPLARRAVAACPTLALLLGDPE